MLDSATLVCLAVAGVAAVCFGLTYHRQASDVPFISSWVPFFGASLRFRRGQIACLQRWTKQHGPVFSLTRLGIAVTYVTDSSLFSPLIKTTALALYPLKAKIMERVFGAAKQAESTALLAKLARRTLLTHLSGASLGQWSIKSHALFKTHLEAALADVPNDANVEVYPWLARVIFATMLETFYGPGLCTPSFQVDLDTLDKAFPVLFMGIPAKWCKVATPRDRLLQAMTDAATRENVSPLVQELWQLYGDKAAPPSQLAFVWSMIYNTIRTTFWLLYYLQTTPGAWTAVEKQVLTNVHGDAPMHAELQGCDLLDAAMKETLRLATTSGFTRVVVADTSVELNNGTTLHLHTGEQVVLHAGVGHHDPTRFEDPHAFRLDRNDDVRPFGLGKFQCPGQYFAVDFVKMVVATLMLETNIARFEGTPTPDFSTPGTFALKDVHAVRMSIQAKHPRAAKTS
ncbi:hypothetical protein LEN26_013467 [Aphanomyces euteiches]|nr:hypothetical protein LEN26_013467 [Aphanomyces euteiches]KAH9124208.1 hypothetical protein AeMF1_004988 [Aphanomyces euteiches]KAH9184730.1 hypothetical protein AeNC1_013293 [Aphanomyces euteiches]